MIVVSDTSPLISLAAIGKLSLLQELYVQILIPTEVCQEATGSVITRPDGDDIIIQDWIISLSVKNAILVQAMESELDRGEAAAISPALELKADLVLIDERLARQVANRMGLNVVGVLGVLLEAKKKGMLSFVRPSLDALLTKAGFWFTPTLYDRVLFAAGENTEYKS